VAYEAHRDQPALTGTHDIRVTELAGALFAAAQAAGASPHLERIIRYVTNRTGLLVEREQGKVYRFPHRTFQEYLAACHLTGGDFPYRLHEDLRVDTQRWREVALLAAAKAVSGAPAAIWTVVEAFCPRQLPADATDGDWYAMVVAAEALIESEQHHQVPARHAALLKELRHYLVKLVADVEVLRQAPQDRAGAGRALSVLGDPRPGVGVDDPLAGGNAVPEMAWVWIPGTDEVTQSGRFPGFEGFKLGDGLKVETEFSNDSEAWPEDALPIGIQGLRMAAYPVTVAQFRPFVAGDGYRNSAYWTKTGWGWREQGQQQAPIVWEQRAVHIDTYPVVGITWYEAVAYCHWLTARLHEKGYLAEGYVVRLPTEAEWEWAARGPQANRWPWGEEWLSGACNSEEAHITLPSAVGTFPAGRNWCGCLATDAPAGVNAVGGDQASAVQDLAGNVWEWCSTRWQERYPLPTISSEWTPDYLDGDETRVLRGGSWADSRSRCRGAYRVRAIPGGRIGIGGFRCCVATSNSDR
jgi:formylglycine-generating enzyme required for sulfatase activity